MFSDEYIHERLQKSAFVSNATRAIDFDESEILDLLKRLFAKLLLNTKTNVNYEVISKYFPDLVMSLHNQPPYMKKYSQFILCQIFWTKENKDQNALMPVNNLQKDTNSSDALIRGDAIKLLTDMCKNLEEIFPFLYEIIKGGIHDCNAYVK